MSSFYQSGIYLRSYSLLVGKPGLSPVLSVPQPTVPMTPRTVFDKGPVDLFSNVIKFEEYCQSNDYLFCIFMFTCEGKDFSVPGILPVYSTVGSKSIC
jgi:hypothetical protein